MTACSSGFDGYKIASLSRRTSDSSADVYEGSAIIASNEYVSRPTRLSARQSILAEAKLYGKAREQLEGGLLEDLRLQSMEFDWFTSTTHEPIKLWVFKSKESAVLVELKSPLFKATV